MRCTNTKPECMSRVTFGDCSCATARLFHDTYERLAPSFGYETRADTKAFDPNSANGKLMIAVCAEAKASIISEIETRFWSIVDADGLSSLPSDMWAALEQLARAARNRDMWKGQCERQAEQLTTMRAVLAEVFADHGKVNSLDWTDLAGALLTPPKRECRR